MFRWHLSWVEVSMSDDIRHHRAARSFLACSACCNRASVSSISRVTAACCSHNAISARAQPHLRVAVLLIAVLPILCQWLDRVWAGGHAVGEADNHRLLLVCLYAVDPGSNRIRNHPQRSIADATGSAGYDSPMHVDLVARLTQRFCPQCRAPLAADAPEGLCPACLMAGGLASATASDPEIGMAATTPPSGSQPPSGRRMDRSGARTFRSSKSWSCSAAAAWARSTRPGRRTSTGSSR